MLLPIVASVAAVLTFVVCNALDNGVRSRWGHLALEIARWVAAPIACFGGLFLLEGDLWLIGVLCALVGVGGVRYGIGYSSHDANVTGAAGISSFDGG